MLGLISAWIGKLEGNGKGSPFVCSAVGDRGSAGWDVHPSAPGCERLQCGSLLQRVSCDWSESFPWCMCVCSSLVAFFSVKPRLLIGVSKRSCCFVPAPQNEWQETLSLVAKLL